MRTLHQVIESILDDDDKVKQDSIVNGLLLSIKDTMISMFGEYRIELLHQLKKNSAKHTKCRTIVFEDNDGQFMTFSDAIRAFKKKLYKINGLELMCRIKKTNEVFRNFTSNFDGQVVVFEFFYNDDDKDKKILEFIMDDMFLNYRTPIIGLGFSFTIDPEYPFFEELFKKN